MPSHTAHSALISLYYAIPGAPWIYAKWKERSGVRHGLFNKDPAKAPRGLSASDVDDIEAYYDMYNKMRREDDKIAFASRISQQGGVVPGRPIWRRWVASLWVTMKMHVGIAAVLTKADCHPITLVNNNPNLKNKVISSQYIPLVLDDFAREFYGSESLDGSGRLVLALRLPTQHIIQRTWINLLRQLARSKVKLAGLEVAAREAFDDLDRENLTKAKLAAVIRAVSKWKALAQVFDNPETIELIDDMDDELKRLMAGIGASVRPQNPGKSKGLCKISEKALRSLASQVGVNDIINLYHDYFNPNDTSEAGPIIEEHRVFIPFGEPVDGADAGMEVEAQMSPDDLAINLGFKDGLPLIFNTHRDRGGSTPWAPANENTFDVNGPHRASLDPIRLHWHQLAGVHSIIRKTFTARREADRCTGILLADEVGLGKTFQAATLIAFLSDLVMRQSHGFPLPPMIVENPFLAEHSDIPNLPHLILVPGTLIDQWLHELQVLFKPHSFDILVYGSGLENHAKFFDAKGPFCSSLLKTNRIILASHSALQQDFGLLYESRAEGRGRLPWDKPEARHGFADKEGKTLFGQRYLSITLDEGHQFRNSGARHNAALAILDRGILKLVATATPLLTSNADIAGIGRLIGIKHFLSEAAWIEEKADNADLRRAKKDAPEEIDLWGDIDDQDLDNPLKRRQIEISLRHQSHFEGRLIRRTINSKDWAGNVLIKIPAYKSILGLVQLTQREMDIITELTESVKDCVSTANGNLKISSRAFYIESRVAVGYAQDGKEKIPNFTTLDEWDRLRSTKMDVVARLCQYTLVSHAAPPVDFEEGVPIFPYIYPLPKEDYTGIVKIAVYQEFPSLGPVLRNVLNLYGIRYLSIDGQTSFAKRALIIKKFADDPSIPVIIFSSVGSAGLNLAMASVMIFLDQPWSAQDERQIIGRVHRQPQQRTVKVYKLLAIDTADMILSTQARGKRDMMEAFLSKEKGQELFDLFSGKSIKHRRDPSDDDEKAKVDDDDDDDGDDGDGGDDDDDDDDDANNRQTNSLDTGEKTKKRNSKKRKPAGQPTVDEKERSKRSRKKLTLGDGETSEASKRSEGVGQGVEMEGRANDKDQASVKDKEKKTRPRKKKSSLIVGGGEAQDGEGTIPAKEKPKSKRSEQKQRSVEPVSPKNTTTEGEEVDTNPIAQTDAEMDLVGDANTTWNAQDRSGEDERDPYFDDNAFDDNAFDDRKRQSDVSMAGLTDDTDGAASESSMHFENPEEMAIFFGSPHKSKSGPRHPSPAPEERSESSQNLESGPSRLIKGSGGHDQEPKRLVEGTARVDFKQNYMKRRMENLPGKGKKRQNTDTPSHGNSISTPPSENHGRPPVKPDRTVEHSFEKKVVPSPNPVAAPQHDVHSKRHVSHGATSKARSTSHVHDGSRPDPADVPNPDPADVPNPDPADVPKESNRRPHPNIQDTSTIRNPRSGKQPDLTHRTPTGWDEGGSSNSSRGTIPDFRRSTPMNTREESPPPPLVRSKNTFKPAQRRR